MNSKVRDPPEAFAAVTEVHDLADLEFVLIQHTFRNGFIHTLPWFWPLLALWPLLTCSFPTKLEWVASLQQWVAWCHLLRMTLRDSIHLDHTDVPRTCRNKRESQSCSAFQTLQPQTLSNMKEERACVVCLSAALSKPHSPYACWIRKSSSHPVWRAVFPPS